MISLESAPGFLRAMITNVKVSSVVCGLCENNGRKTDREFSLEEMELKSWQDEGEPVTVWDFVALYSVLF